MDFETIKTTFLDFVRENRAWAPFIVAGLAFGESIAVISIFIPATVLMVGIGALVETGGFAFWPIWAGAVLGAVIGDIISYEFGRHFQHGAKTIWPLSRQPKAVERGEEYMRRWGAGAVFVGRFFGPIRAVVPLIAGIFVMPRDQFMLANVSSALVWAFLLLTAGDLAGEAAGRILGRMGY